MSDASSFHSNMEMSLSCSPTATSLVQVLTSVCDPRPKTAKNTLVVEQRWVYYLIAMRKLTHRGNCGVTQRMLEGIYYRIWLVSDDLGRVQGSRALLCLAWCQEVGLVP